MEKPSDAVGRVLAKILAPIVVPVWPEVYHEAYITALVNETAQIATFDGLTAGNVQKSYLALALRPLTHKDEGDADTVWQAIVRAPRILIYGCVGSGKSALLRALAWRIADSPNPNQIHMVTFKHFVQATQELLPVIVNLADFQNQKPDILGAMATSLKELDFPSSRAYLRQRLQAGQCIVMLDGFDALTSQTHRKAVADFVRENTNTLMIVTSRPGAPAPELDGFFAYQIRGMTDEQRTQYIRNCLPNSTPVANGILAACERSAHLAGMASRPLMASAMCSSQLRASEPRPRVSELCDACLDALLGTWNHSPIWAGHQEQSDLRSILGTLALACLSEDTHSIDREKAMSIVESHPQAKNAGATLAFQGVTLDTGILCRDMQHKDRLRVFSPMLMNYLAAQEIVKTGQMDRAFHHISDPNWAEAVVLAVGMSDETEGFKARIETVDLGDFEKTRLLSRCCAEMSTTDPALVADIEQRLFAVLEQDMPDQWRPAAVSLASMSRTPVAEHLSQLTHAGDTPDTRRLAALAIGRLALPEGVAALTMAITDKDSTVAKQAVWSLGQIPLRQSVHALPRALKHKSSSVRQEATRSLARLGSQTGLGATAIDNLITALDPERNASDSVLYAEEALLEIGPSATPVLISTLGKNRTKSAHKIRIARVLGLMGDPSALPVLIDNLYREDSDNLDSLIDSIACVGADAVPTLIRSLNNSDISESSRLVSVLARIGEPAVEPLIDAIGGEQPEVRNSAVRALAAIGAPATDALIDALLTKPNPQTRRSVLSILRTIGDGRVIDALIRSLNDSDEGVQSNALRYLGSLENKRAVPSLITFSKGAQNTSQLRLALTSLGRLRDPRALPVLFGKLSDSEASDAAISALRAMGNLAVDGLIAMLHAQDTTADARAVIWSILADIGGDWTGHEETPEALAAAYSKLADPELSPKGILDVTRSLDWWRHGRELYQSLETATALAEANDIEQISRHEDTLLWVDSIAEWLRPQVRDILQELHNIVQSTELFYQQTRSESERDALMQSRDALLTAIDRLDDTRQIVQEYLLPFEFKIFEGLIDKWHKVIHAAVRRLRGQAKLTIALSTPTITIRDNQSQGTAVFRLFNRGDGAARNISVQVSDAASYHTGVMVLDSEAIPLRSLGIGDQREFEVDLAHGGARSASLSVEIRYDDDERTGAVEHFGCSIEFIRAHGEYRRIVRSPYVVGMPVKSDRMFFGRQDVFDWVRENICNTTQPQPLLMYGERRMGKTSVLYQLLREPPTPDHFCILFDLQLYSYINTIPDFMYHLSQAVIQGASMVGIDLPEYDRADFDPDGYSTFNKFARDMENTFGEKRLVIMMDEFGILLDKVRNGVFQGELFDFLRGITQQAECFTFIFTGSYEVRSMQQDFDSILFNMPKVYRITYLTEVEATKLIQEPVKGLLAYHPLVVDRILGITACHPYFVQYICGELVRLARTEKRNYVELNDLEIVMRGVVQDATGNIENSIYVNLSEDEKLVLAAAAEVTDEVHKFVLMSAITKALDSRGLSLSTERVLAALRSLRERDLITEMRIGQQLRYAFRMGLIQRWLKQQEILLRLLMERGK